MFSDVRAALATVTTQELAGERSFICVNQLVLTQLLVCCEAFSTVRALVLPLRFWQVSLFMGRKVFRAD